MRKNHFGYIKNLLLPCVAFSSFCGVLTALIVFAFKIISSKVIELSEYLYNFIREKPIWLPIFILIAIALGGIVWLLTHNNTECQGGGIPTAVAALRGFISLRWIKSVLLLPLSALITFFVGIPLGNEGPCVQMGTAIGRGTVQMLGKKKHQAWSRYIMTGGACAGFAAATSAPVTGIIFAFEEAHRHFTPILFMVASISVLTGQITTELLGAFTGIDPSLFHFRVEGAFPIKYLWMPVIVGLACGIVAILFTKAYRLCNKLVRHKLTKIPFIAKILAIFVATVFIGFLSPDNVGSGHSLINILMANGRVWYILILCFLIRAVLLLFSNNTGITGGIFVPTLTFGAIIGALCGKALISVGLISASQYEIMIVIGMVAFLSAASRTPITAVVFAAEALCGFAYILPVAIAVAVAYIIIEIVGIEGFNDTVIHSKVNASHKGRAPIVFDVYLTVKEGAFVIDKEIRDILWPSTCVVLGIDKNVNAKNKTGISEGDVLHVHYQSYSPHATFEELERIVGEQSEDIRLKIKTHGKNHEVPEI